MLSTTLRWQAYQLSFHTHCAAKSQALWISQDTTPKSPKKYAAYIRASQLCTWVGMQDCTLVIYIWTLNSFQLLQRSWRTTLPEECANMLFLRDKLSYSFRDQFLRLERRRAREFMHHNVLRRNRKTSQWCVEHSGPSSSSGLISILNYGRWRLSAGAK